MAGVPTNFQALSNVLANYNFVDIVAGTGYVTFYAGYTTPSGTNLSNFQYYSNAVYTSGGMTGTNFVNVLDVDFDTPLNRPLDVKGTAIVNIGVKAHSGAGVSCDYYFILYFRKWDGVTETDIANSTSATYNLATDTFATRAINITIPLTHFKIGETLRLTVMAYAKATVGAGSDETLYIGTDPMGRTTGWDTTGAVSSKLTLQCPVRLNL